MNLIFLLQYDGNIWSYDASYIGISMWLKFVYTLNLWPRWPVFNKRSLVRITNGTSPLHVWCSISRSIIVYIISSCLSTTKQTIKFFHLFNKNMDTFNQYKVYIYICIDNLELSLLIFLIYGHKIINIYSSDDIINPLNR